MIVSNVKLHALHLGLSAYSGDEKYFIHFQGSAIRALTCFAAVQSAAPECVCRPLLMLNCDSVNKQYSSIRIQYISCLFLF